MDRYEEYTDADWHRLHIALYRSKWLIRWDRVIAYSLLILGSVAFWVAMFLFVIIPLMNLWSG